VSFLGAQGSTKFRCHLILNQEKRFHRKEKTEARVFLVTFWPSKSDKDKLLEVGYMSSEHKTSL